MSATCGLPALVLELVVLLPLPPLLLLLLGDDTVTVAVTVTVAGTQAAVVGCQGAQVALPPLLITVTILVGTAVT